jgi:ADP-L-glycero-D-manno-heptose 6-epimerase
MILITGGAGFIGSVLIGYLNKKGITDLIVCDDLPFEGQFKNLISKEIVTLRSIKDDFSKFDNISCVVHLGADANTLNQNWKDVYESNVVSTRMWNDFCTSRKIPFIFSSSAAIYGNGFGPLNLYAFSKLLSEKEINGEGVILRFFNVYGPNEYHKDRMASTIYHWFMQSQKGDDLKIFLNSNQYSRDFIWVEDVARIIFHFIQNYQPGLYDVGTGVSTNFVDLSEICINYLPKIDRKFVPMPGDLKNQYQTFTKADISNLEKSGFDVNSFTLIDKGIPKYFCYLTDQTYY